MSGTTLGAGRCKGLEEGVDEVGSERDGPEGDGSEGGDEACADATAWEGLEDMRGVLRSFLARHCPDANDVEDVIQETFLRAARYRRAHRVQNLRPWAMRIALNVLADSKRRVVRTQAPCGDVPFDPPSRPRPACADSAYRIGERWVDGESARELLLHTLAGLRDKDRSLLDSYYGGERTTQSASRECGIPQELVKVRLYRARQRLLNALNQRVSGDSKARGA